MSFPPYKSYRNSEIEWLGEVPNHWESSRLSNLFREVSEEGQPDLPILSVSIHNGVSDRELSAEDLDRNTNRSEDRSKYKRVQPGDLVYNMMRAWQGAFGTVLVTGMVSPAYVVARPKGKLNAHFLEMQLRTSAAVEEMRRHSSGVTDFRLRLYWESFKDFVTALPPPSEQDIIVEFLDRETSKIDGLIEAQRRLIELLREKRQAVISHAVTKGLDPTVLMKPSGIESLGDVPAHWKTTRIKFAVSAVVDCLHTTPTYEGILEYPAIRTADVERGQLLLSQARLVCREVYEDRIQRMRPIANDILYSREGERFGMAAVVPDGVDLCLGQRMMMFRVASSFSSGFLMWILNSEAVYQQVLAGLGGATSPHVNISDIKNFYIAEPYIDEQMHISEFIDKQVEKIDALFKQASGLIDLLMERRVALISAAVTGQIDVRGVEQRRAEAA